MSKNLAQSAALTEKAAQILELKKALKPIKSLDANRGVPTGLMELDQKLAWGGFPKGAISLLYGDAGVGVLQLWLQSAVQLTKQNRWVAWIDGTRTRLCPWWLYQQKADLSRWLTLHGPKNASTQPGSRKLVWVIDQLMDSHLFDLIGCDLDSRQLNERSLLKLQRHARQSQVALVLVAPTLALKSSFYAMVVHVTREKLCVERALHRPTPFTLPRRNTYAHSLSHSPQAKEPHLR